MTEVVEALGDNRAGEFMEFVDKILELEADKLKYVDAIKAEWAKAAAAEFDVKAMKQAIKLATSPVDIGGSMGQRTSVAAYLATIVANASDDDMIDRAKSVLESEVR